MNKEINIVETDIAGLIMPKLAQNIVLGIDTLEEWETVIEPQINKVKCQTDDNLLQLAIENVSAYN